VMLKRNLADNIKTALIAIGFEDVNRTWETRGLFEEVIRINIPKEETFIERLIAYI
jgi:hypothetical protein